MNLIVVHHHFRPGGVRRVIETALPALARATGAQRLTLAGGEPVDPTWLAKLRLATDQADILCRVEPGLAYRSESALPYRTVSTRLKLFFLGLVKSSPSIIWAHNLGLGRNLELPRILALISRSPGTKVVFHHHDWWFDNRWQRWSEMRQHGFRSLRSVALAIFPPNSPVRHAVINQADARALKQHLPSATFWIPNPMVRPPQPNAGPVREARRWLREQMGGSRPTWLLPARLLRRKNIAEALLLTRWLRPEACLVTTGAPSSADEQPYADRLHAAARKEGWPLRLSVLAGDERNKPSVASLMAASEALVFTSVQEGFGLPFVEAAAAKRPLIARSLPNVAPDLAAFGFRFPQAYDDIWIEPSLFNWEDERRRQARLLQKWSDNLPAQLRSKRTLSPLGKTPRPVAFSRLTLTAQLQVLRVPADRSWTAVVRLNPFLGKWRLLAARRGLLASPWPRSASKSLGPDAYGNCFLQMAQAPVPPIDPSVSIAVLRDFVAEKLHPSNQYPLLWFS